MTKLFYITDANNVYFSFCKKSNSKYVYTHICLISNKNFINKITSSSFIDEIEINLNDIGNQYKIKNYQEIFKKYFKKFPFKIWKKNYTNQWFWCPFCDTPCIKCIHCDHTSCSGYSCDSCKEDFDIINKIDINDLPKKEEIPFTIEDIHEHINNILKNNGYSDEDITKRKNYLNQMYIDFNNFNVWNMEGCQSPV